MMAATEAEWCGARKGGTRTSPAPGGSTPLTEWIRVTSSDASSGRSGRIPGSRRASIVFPSRAARRAAGCGLRPRRPPAPGAPAPGRERRRGRERLRATRSRRPAPVRLGRVALATEVGDCLGQVVHGDRLDSGQSDLGARLGGADEMRERPSAARLRRRRARRGRAAAARRVRARRPRRAPRAPRAASGTEAASTARAIGRSKPEPSLRRAAGARLTVMRRLVGHSSSAEEMPLRTRSFASWHARSASPTMANDGSAALEVRLDLDPARIDADERMGDGACEHMVTLGGRCVTCLSRLRARSVNQCRRTQVGVRRRDEAVARQQPPAGRCCATIHGLRRPGRGSPQTQSDV